MIHICFLLAIGTDDENETSCFTRLIRQRFHNDIIAKDAVAKELAVLNNISLTDSGHGQ